MDELEIKKLIGTKEGRRLLSIHSPSFFATYYMDFDYVEHQNIWIKKCIKIQNEAKEKNGKESKRNKFIFT